MQDFKPRETEGFHMNGQNPEQDGDTSHHLHQTINKHNKPEIKRLIKSGIDVNAASKKGMTALHFAAQDDNPNAVEILELLLNAGANANAAAEDGTTPLHWAVLSSNSKGIKLLLNHRADINCREKISYFTPLHLATYIGDTIIVDLLINRGAKVDRVAKNDVTPLHLASIKGCLRTVQTLVNYGSSVHRLTNIGKHTMLHLALMDRKEDVKQIINVNDNRSECCSYLKSIKVVDFRNRKRLYRYLVAQGIDINQKDDSGKTALHYAACCSFNGTVKWILSLGANHSLKDNDGHLSFHYALLNDNNKGLWDLIQFGADINDVRAIRSLIPRIMNGRPIGGELARHLNKLKAANLFIASVYIPFIDVGVDKTYFQHCLLNVAKMRTWPVNENISVYDMLHIEPKSRIVLLENHKVAIRECKLEIPMYAGIIEASYQETVYWDSLVRSAIPAYCEVVGHYLPDICVENIFSHLDAYTLRMIIDTIN